MSTGSRLLAALFLSLPILAGCGKAGQLERPQARPGEVRDIDAGSEPGRTLRTADPRDRSSEPLPPLAAPPARGQDPSEP
ncbi:hypothetical protein [Phenylobacterium sp.]|jgi:hypothetical protein|uniref:hypothetical protein n=1 Tax=Phenylobacterium sp. TaxID=1871053 RepID=UPI0025ECD413|nr:hypothetical protein [Phenylobacterium sp.]MCA3721660.1 hypothetical protein [Phenylobacterium sp.]